MKMKCLCADGALIMAYGCISFAEACTHCRKRGAPTQTKRGLVVASRRGHIQGEDTIPGMIAARINANRAARKEAAE